jgi:putative SOS response-associated peptidase YedK
MTDIAPIVKGVDAERGAGELVNRRWSWPAPKGQPVYNFRADGREFSARRCLILADGFYEFMWTTWQSCRRLPFQPGLRFRYA